MLFRDGPEGGQLGVRLVRGRERQAAVDALAAATGGRVGLAGVLADLDRSAGWVHGLGPDIAWALAWDRADSTSSRWWPQGITSSADANPTGRVDGRSVLVTTSYSKTVDGLHQGARISVVDLSDPRRIRYRHVLLVVAAVDAEGRLSLSPLRAHAGGAVWHGPYLHVAGTGRGVYTFRPDDIVAVAGTDRPDVLGALDGPGGGWGGFGHRYVLPLWAGHAARTAEGSVGLRYSFLSLGRDAAGGSAPHLLVGEYGHGSMTTRLMRYDLDPVTALPRWDRSGAAAPVLHDAGVARMQGAVSVDGRLHVTTSHGRRGRGSLWVGAPGSLYRHLGVLPPGPEDICFWPGRDQLLTVTEYPGRRFVLGLDRDRFA